MSAGRSGWTARRRLGRALTVTVSLAVFVGVAAGALHWVRETVAAREAFPITSGRFPVSGLAASIAIHRDDRGIPHVEAANEADALFGLGFVHAQDRLAQMAWLRRLARGRSAEVVGPEGLEADRLARTLDFEGLAAVEFAGLDGATAALVEAYTAGVNARIARIRDGFAELPLALRGDPEPLDNWRPTDSVALLKLYSWGLAASFDTSLVLTDLIEQLGGREAHRFRPRAPGPSPSSSVVARRRSPTPLDPLRRAMHLRGSSIGSSGWVVGAGYSESRSPILVADSHLETTAPSLLYVAHFRGGDLDVAGSTIPGIPVVWTGRNTRLAWGATNARAITTDLYEEEVGRRDPSTFFDGSRWRPLSERQEVLRVKGGRTDEFTVRATSHGPLLGDLVEGDRKRLALAWTGARPDAHSGIASMLDLARADGEASFLEALARHEEPPLAMVYAVARGGAGMQVAGWIPRRALVSGLVPIPGRARWYEWNGRIPFEDLPNQRISDRGWAIAADNVFAADGRKDTVEWLWRSGTRARRIDSLLRNAVTSGPLSLRQATALQSDVGMDRARRLVANALSLTDDGAPLGAESREVATFLGDWDGRALHNSAGAAAYHLFLSGLTRRLLEPRLGAEMLDRYMALPQVDPDLVVFEIVRDAANGGVDEWSDPEKVAAAVREGLRETWFNLTYQLGANRDKWRWGRLHRLAFESFIPGRNLTARQYAIAPFGHGGSADTVSVGEYDRALPFAVRTASTFRFAVDTAKLDQALVSLAPGQSGHPGHPHFADGVERWREGRSQLLITAPLLIEESSQAVLRLEPRS